MTIRTDTDGRPLDLVLARIHLRTGSLGLARAELEAFAGAGLLDPAGLADLAEARWRTGDLIGAGDAAQAHLDGGGTSLVALVVAAEAVAELGRPGEARALAARAVERLDRPLDGVMAGMPRSPIWPTGGQRESTPVVEPSLEAPVPTDTAAAPAPSDGESALESARTAISEGDLAGAAIQLAVAVRLAPLLAPAVLAVADGHRSPGLDLVRGDALAALGREAEARRAWADAQAALRAPEGAVDDRPAPGTADPAGGDGDAGDADQAGADAGDADQAGADAGDADHDGAGAASDATGP